jgi:flavin reductase (DIM6/NTAB) family NADH-FMN oxidoreductase RutF
MAIWKKSEPKSLKENTFSIFDDKWAAVAAEKDGKVNTMTISWGSLGILWDEQIVTIYIRNSRYTREFMDASETFSITVFDESYRKALSDVIGSKSGRDLDKIKAVGWTVEHIGGTPVFGQANLAFICKKIYRHEFQKEEFCDKVYQEKVYSRGDFHVVYIGRIEGMYEKQ